MKQLIASMNQLERKHYEHKIAKLDKLIEQVHESGERVTMGQLLDRVGLLTIFTEPKTNLLVAESPKKSNTMMKHYNVHSSQAISQRRGTERQEPSSQLLSLMSDDDDKTKLSSSKISADHHIKVLQRINEDKQIRKRQE